MKFCSVKISVTHLYVSTFVVRDIWQIYDRINWIPKLNESTFLMFQFLREKLSLNDEKEKIYSASISIVA